MHRSVGAGCDGDTRRRSGCGYAIHPGGYPHRTLPSVVTRVIEKAALTSGVAVIQLRQAVCPMAVFDNRPSPMRIVQVSRGNPAVTSSREASMWNVETLLNFRPDAEGDRDLNTLALGKIWLGKIERLNDPTEGVSLKQIAQDSNAQAIYRGVGIASFCRSRSNPLLWCHYARGHKGFAVGYDRSHDFFNVTDGGAKPAFLDVRYEDVPPVWSEYADVQKFVLDALTTKPTCWAYEQEVRLVVLEGGLSHDIPKDAVVEILFGAEMTDSRVDEIQKRIRGSDFSPAFFKMRYAASGYGVVPELIQ